MPTVITKFNWGNALLNQNPLLTRQLSESYSDLAICINTKSSVYVTDGINKPHVNAPAVSSLNANYSIGDMFVRTDTDTAWIMTSRTTSEAVTWTQIT